ncbi:LuxR family transcriptional regulator [Rhizobium tropici]|uniref:LuxR family transcriptional regulator n=1 Tax=Rhizobium tropici TaxID=398 RepID=UPI001FEDCE43|nr:LuxR family transcriptional regulator [Rhizobium tropici]
MVLAEIRQAYGFAHATLLVVRAGISPRPYPFFCTTYPSEWTATYLRKNYFEIDPVIAISRTGFLPVDWYVLRGSSEKGKAFLSDARAFGVGRHGLTVPVRGANGERSLFSVTSDMSRSNWRRLRDSSICELQVFSQYLHDKAVLISDLRASGAHDVLSRRERECLQLIARGEPPKRIAATLQISEGTVRLYLRLARRKLGARTLYQAIARASLLEVIDV